MGELFVVLKALLDPGKSSKDKRSKERKGNCL
jgi:hypothetical protein